MRFACPFVGRKRLSIVTAVRTEAKVLHQLAPAFVTHPPRELKQMPQITHGRKAQPFQTLFIQ